MNFKILLEKGRLIPKKFTDIAFYCS